MKQVDSHFDIIKLEKDILKYWEENKTFEKLIEKNRDGEIWSFLDGPITANNPMGVHHAWGRTLKDAYQRYWAMNGRKQRYQNGYDCQGLWVEVEVEKTLGFQSKKDIEKFGINNFVEKCKERALKYSDIITQQSIRLGYWMDWNNSYYTLSDENNYTIWQFLKKVYERGFLFKGHDVMPWCPRCGTGISQHEMHEGYKETSHLSLVTRFPILNRSKEAFLVWTTTPWTLTSNVAIAVHRDFIYLKVKQGEWIYYIIKSRAKEILDQKGEWETLEEIKGIDLYNKNLTYSGPFDELPAQEEAKLSHKVILWEDVTEEEGTGIVHIAPGCGVEDFGLGKLFDLPVISPLDDNGYFQKDYDWLNEKHASKVGKEIADNLKSKGILYSKENYSHSYPHCWRCKEELLFRLVDEWFIEMDPWRKEIINLVKQINWIPSFGGDLELDWLTNMHDWMISKKRYWGLALPIWECDECKNFTVIGSLEELRELAVEGLDKFEGHSPHRPWIDEVKIKCDKCGKIISRIKDVGNPWLDAGIVPYSTVKYNTDREYWQQWVPPDLILECFPGQFRNWFYSLLAMSTMMENIPPFKTLVGHALVRDEDGDEMHKSKGNAIWFDEAADKIGVEVMRWMFCNHEISTNLNFGYNNAKLIRGKIINTLWNSYAFYVNYASLINFKISKKSIPVDERPDFDRWILAKSQELIINCRKRFEAYDIRTATREIDDFLEILSNWYIRNNRRRFWRSEMDADTISAYETFFEVFYTLMKILAPILPMLTEEMYQNMVRTIAPDHPESIHLTSYPVAEKKIIDENAELVHDMDRIIKLKKLALSARVKSKHKIRQPLSKMIVAPKTEGDIKSINRFSNLLKNELNIKSIELTDLNAPCPIKLEVRPNKKTLGQKYKAQSKMIAQKIDEQLDTITGELNNNSTAWEKSFDIDGDTITITREDLLITEIDPPNLSVERNNDGWIAFDTQLTEELVLEGLMRDFVRNMQVLRRDMDLNIEDRIRIKYKTDSTQIKQMFKNHLDYIFSELLCLELKEDPQLVSDHKLKLSSETVDVIIEKAVV